MKSGHMIWAAKTFARFNFVPVFRSCNNTNNLPKVDYEHASSEIVGQSQYFEMWDVIKRYHVQDQWHEG